MPADQTGERPQMLASLATFAVLLAAEAAKKEGGLPQLNPHDFAPQLIWLALTFGALYFLLSKVALPKVGGVIEARRQRIQRDLDDATRLKGETEQALATYEASLASARTRAGGIAKDMRDKLATEVDGQRATVEKQVGSRLADAERRIADMKSKAMTEVGQIATDTAEAIVAQLTGKPVSKDEVRQAVKLVAGE